MGWEQCFAIMGTTLGAVIGVFLINRKDMQLMESKWERLFSLFIEQHKQK